QGLAGPHVERHAAHGRHRAGIGREGDREIADAEDRSGRRHQCMSIRASSASRSPSPTKLKLATASVIIRPGKIASHGAETRYCWALFSMLPQLAVGGWIP